MKKEDIQPWDWQRILLGQAPLDFLLEVLLRTVFTYLLLMVVIRMLGKRMDGQLTLTEFAVMLTFGAIVSVPMQMPDRGVLLGVVAMICVLAFQRGLTWLTVKNEKTEEVTQGTHSILVKNGVLQLDEMLRAGLSKQHLFAELRKKQIFNLGKVKRVYFEACGMINIYPENKTRPGLVILPSDEMELIRAQTTIDQSHKACLNCGNVVDSRQAGEKCSVCGNKKWMDAIV
jgi:uncharacterized membrane protein YcaP (DUF421 family)